MSGRNVVPMPVQPVARSTPQAPMPMTAPWPMPPGGFPAGCCPPGGMDALLQCYCDIQAATAFISKVVTDLAANDPAFQQALVDAIAASGSNIPLIGVTNGVAAQPGQVGEFIQFVVDAACPASNNTQAVTMGVLPPGDWDVWASASANANFTSIDWFLNPVPAGFGGNVSGSSFVSGQNIEAEILAPVTNALTSAPSLINFTLATAAANTFSLHLVFSARRAR